MDDASSTTQTPTSDVESVQQDVQDNSPVGARPALEDDDAEEDTYLDVEPYEDRGLWKRNKV